MKSALVMLALASAAGSAFAADKTPAASEAEALALLMGVNTHEILAADLAANKDVSPPVAAYAAMLRKEHTENQEATKKLPEAAAAEQADTAPVVAQEEKGAAERAELASKSGDAFEKAYVEAMVTGHADALEMIDEQLIPAARSADVKAHLVQTRAHVAMHLEQAKALASK